MPSANEPVRFTTNVPSGKSLGSHAETAESTEAGDRAERAEQRNAHPCQHAYQCRPQRASSTPATASAMPAAMLATG